MRHVWHESEIVDATEFLIGGDRYQMHEVTVIKTKKGNTTLYGYNKIGEKPEVVKAAFCAETLATILTSENAELAEEVFIWDENNTDHGDEFYFSDNKFAVYTIVYFPEHESYGTMSSDNCVYRTKKPLNREELIRYLNEEKARKVS